MDVPKPTSDFQYVESGAIVSVQFHLKNSGNSPALNIEIDGEMPLLKSHLGIFKRQDIICNRLRDRPIGNAGSGFAIFPNDQALPLTTQYSVGKEEIDSALKANTLPIPVITPVIIGCIRYVFRADSSQHETAFVYFVNHTSPAGLIRTDQGDIPKDQILLIIPDFGSGRIN